MTTSHRKPMLAPGQVLNGRWEIIRHIATGGKGEVYLARQLKLEREVALKIVSQELIDAYDDDQEEIDAEMERFRREVLAMAKTHHANVLQVYDYEDIELEVNGQVTALDFIVMEYVAGDTLAGTIPEDGLGGDQAALLAWITDYFLPVLDGVEHIHAQGIIHRDLKPANVLLADGVPKITDFGLVGGKIFQPVTRSHHVIGTLAYMAPEQFMDMGETDFRADIYSLGKILYNAVVGKLGKDSMMPLKNASIPKADTPLLKALNRLIQKATAEERDNRFTNVDELRDELGKVLAREAPMDQGPGKSRLSMIVILALAGLLFLGVWFHFAEAPEVSSPPREPQGNRAERPRAEGPPPASIFGRDGETSRLVPAGEKLASFYLDETEVTNHQFVNFLNQVLDRTKVEEGMVRGDGDMWLRLGQIQPGYEPIVFENGRFRIKDPKLAANPVVNVTAFGAAAYAKLYDRRLPTIAELLFARTMDGPAQKAGAHAPTQPAPVSQGHAHMSAPAPAPKTAPAPLEKLFPVTHYPPNRLGIRGLSANASEWATRRAADKIEYLALHPGREPVPHQPWEATGRIGFRCAQSAPAK